MRKTSCLLGSGLVKGLLRIRVRIKQHLLLESSFTYFIQIITEYEKKVSSLTFEKSYVSSANILHIY